MVRVDLSIYLQLDECQKVLREVPVYAQCCWLKLLANSVFEVLDTTGTTKPPSFSFKLHLEVPELEIHFRANEFLSAEINCPPLSVIHMRKLIAQNAR